MTNYSSCSSISPSVVNRYPPFSPYHSLPYILDFLIPYWMVTFCFTLFLSGDVTENVILQAFPQFPCPLGATVAASVGQ